MVAARVPVTDGRVRIQPDDYPALMGASGHLRVQPGDGTTAIEVLRVGASEFVALSTICTHLGCTVDVSGGQLVCPCHGSTYGRRGEVLRGPTEAPLVSYPVAVTKTGELVIDVRGAS